MDDITFRAFMDLLMCFDPWPVKDTGILNTQKVLVLFAEKQARKRGYEGWIDAYHRLDLEK